MTVRVQKAKLNVLDLDSDPSVVTDVSVDGGQSDATYGTRAHWEANPGFVPDRGQIVVWSDRGKTTVGGAEVDVPGVKIGDGNAFNIDLPFVGDDVAARLLALIQAHVDDPTSHVSSSDRKRWDNKITASDEVHDGTLVLSRN